MKPGNNRVIRLVLALAMCLVIGGYLIAFAKTVTIWKWVDDKGIAHYVDEYYKIPDKYKPKAVEIEIKVVEPQHSSDPPPKKHPPGKKKTEEAQKKEAWQKKARKAVEEVKRLEKAIEETEAECVELHQKWTNMPVIANQEALAECHKKLEQLKAALAKAREYRDRGIYKDAVQAGIPVSWIEGILKAK